MGWLTRFGDKSFFGRSDGVTRQYMYNFRRYGIQMDRRVSQYKWIVKDLD